MLLVLILAGIGVFYSYSKSIKGINKDSAGTAALTNKVDIKNYAFSPQEIKVKKGTTVMWENYDLVPHTITMDEKSKTGPNSELFGKGKNYSYIFSTPGTYAYHCEPHPYMKAVVVVTE